MTGGGSSRTGEAGTTVDGLHVQELGVALPDADGTVHTVLERVDLDVRPGELVVLLGPSGAGKSTLVAALLGLLPVGALVRGQARWSGRDGADPTDLLDPDGADRERTRGRLAAWLPQSPLASLTPVLTVGHHLREKARVHAPASGVDALVGAAVERHEVDRAWWSRLPSQLSGGQAQRVSNALSLLGDPMLVLADEPTTGLDRPRATRAGAELASLARDEGRAVLVVTHDLALAEQIADAVVELDAGITGERLPPGTVGERVRAASHRHAPHRATAATTAATATTATATTRPPSSRTERPALVGTALTLTRGRGTVVLDGVDVRVEQDRTTGLLAPSGSGKTTLLRTLALLHPPAGGHVELDGRRVEGTGHRVPAQVRRRIGYVPQDPRSSVDPHWTIGRTLAEPLRLGGLPADDAVVASLMDRVGLEPDLATRRPDAVSGGQLQRVVVARALALEPDYLLLDEPTSMVDARTARVVLAAVHAHQHATGCGVLVASHDVELLRTWCDDVIVWDV